MDKVDGKGIYHTIDGSTYEGDWKGDRVDGQGRFTSAEGDMYSRVGEMWMSQYFWLNFYCNLFLFFLIKIIRIPYS